MKLRETVFFLLVNETLQVGLFALFAAALSRFAAKLSAKQQHAFYVSVFLLCVIAPVTNTLWQTQPATTRRVLARKQQKATVRFSCGTGVAAEILRRP